jgi:hypothetical protein
VDVVGVVEAVAISRYPSSLEGAEGGIEGILEKEEEGTLEGEAEGILEGEEGAAGLQWKSRFSGKLYALVFLGCFATNDMSTVDKAMVRVPTPIRRSNESKINPPLK